MTQDGFMCLSHLKPGHLDHPCVQRPVYWYKGIHPPPPLRPTHFGLRGSHRSPNLPSHHTQFFYSKDNRMATPANTAAYLTATNTPLEIAPAPYPTPAKDEIIIKTHAIAFNPVDWAIQAHGPSVFTFITLPAILGYDVAGTVTATGASVTK